MMTEVDEQQITTDSAPSVSTYKLRRRTPGSFLLVACPQIGRSLRCQGQLEAATAVILAGCPEVKSVHEQPLEIWYSWQETSDGLDIHLLKHTSQRRIRKTNSQRSSYVVPDFLVELLDGTIHLVEVKPSHRLSNTVVRRKLAASRRYAAEQNWQFYAVSEKELLAGPLVRNLRLLNRYRLVRTDNQHLRAIESSIRCEGSTVADLEDHHDSYMTAAELRLHIFHLLAKDLLSFDPRSRPIDDDTMIFPGGVITWNPFDSVWAPNGRSTDAPSV